MRRDALPADCGGMQRVLTAHWLALDPSAVRLFRHPHPATRSHAGWQLCADLPSTHPRSLASHADEIHCGLPYRPAGHDMARHDAPLAQLAEQQTLNLRGALSRESATATAWT